VPNYVNQARTLQDGDRSSSYGNLEYQTNDKNTKIYEKLDINNTTCKKTWKDNVIKMSGDRCLKIG
jgi:hypothetical protein